MDETIKTVLLSIGTSLIVSLITFILGLRSGKNQADRQKLQELYKQLYAHFTDLKKSIQEDRCKTWENYEYVEKGSKRVFTPPVRKLEYSGDLIYLKNKIAKKASELEFQIMNYGSREETASKDIHTVLLENLDLLNDGYVFEDYSHNKGQKNNLNTCNPTGCRTFRLYSYRDFFYSDRMKKIFSEWDKKQDYGLNFSAKGNPPAYSFCIYPNGLAVSSETFLKKIEDDFRNKVEGYSDAQSVRTKLLKEINALTKKLSKRAKEPYSFWETFFGAFADLFR